jgi:uncharacterized membrane protein YphA (DoxX/SURF4 family)
MKYIFWLFRIVVGCLFIFSGLIKANDPLGLSYKMNEFFEVWNMHGLADYSLALSILMIGFEVIAGVALLLGYAFRMFSFLLLLLTAFFTFLTAYVYLTGKIKECGCFGDCIKLSNAETFWKDVVLLIMVIVLFFFRGRIKPLFHRYVGVSLVILSAFFVFGMQWWALEHLPFHDCLPYKIGANITEKMKAPSDCIPDSVATVLYYKNLKTGERKGFDLTNYPWEDTVNWQHDTTMTEVVRKGNCEVDIKDFAINDYAGASYTEQILTTPGYAFLLFVKDPTKARTDNIDHLRALMKKANTLNIPFYILTSGNQEQMKAFKEKHNLFPADDMVFDGTASRTALRSDPGLMLIEQGTIRGKWSFRDYPKNIEYVGGKLKTD